MEDSNNIQVDSSTNDVCEQLGNIGIDNDSDDDHDSDYDEEESDDEDWRIGEDWIDIDEDILRRLKENDPTIAALSLSMGTAAGVFDALSIDWELEGGAVAENTHLKSLSIEFGPGDEPATANAKAFYGSLSKNKSIDHLYMYGVISFTILSTFFEHNHNLPSLLKY